MVFVTSIQKHFYNELNDLIIIYELENDLNQTVVNMQQ